MLIWNFNKIMQINRSQYHSFLHFNIISWKITKDFFFQIPNVLSIIKRKDACQQWRNMQLMFFSINITKYKYTWIIVYKYIFHKLWRINITIFREETLKNKFWGDRSIAIEVKSIFVWYDNITCTRDVENNIFFGYIFSLESCE